MMFDLRMTRVIILFLGLTLVSFPASATAASPVGRWKGSWSSQTTGHRGPLRARIRQVDADTYRAVFVGRFAGVVPFLYPATLQRVPGQCDCYTSRQRLPLMGSYQMTARIDGQRFEATIGRGRTVGFSA